MRDPYLKIYKNRANYVYSHTVLKGDDLYDVHIAAGEKMRWKYLGKIDPKVYQVNGILVRKPPIKTIVILQRMLQPQRVNESYNPDKSIWRKATQEWLKEFIDNEGFIDHKDRFISFSFDPDAGGQDDFGNGEVLIEFDKDLLLKQAHQQELGEIEYDLYYMEDHPDVAIYVLGRTKEDYFEETEVQEDWDNREDYWEYYIQSFEHEQEIVLKQLSDEEGLIKSITFNKPADLNLINKLKRKNISYKLKAGLVNDPQKVLQFESFKNWKIINEQINFEKGINPKKFLHVGVEHLIPQIIEKFEESQFEVSLRGNVLDLLEEYESSPENFHNPAGYPKYDWDWWGNIGDFKISILYMIDLNTSEIARKRTVSNPNIQKEYTDKESWKINSLNPDKIYEEIEQDATLFDIADAAEFLFESYRKQVEEELPDEESDF